MEQGRLASTAFPLAMTIEEFISATSDGFLPEPHGGLGLKRGHHAVHAASQSFQTGSYPSRRRISATSCGGRASEISNCPVAFVSCPSEGAAHSLEPVSTIRRRRVG